MNAHAPDPSTSGHRVRWAWDFVDRWDEPLVVLDSRGRVLHTNPILDQLLGGALPLSSFTDLVEPDDRSSVRRSLEHWAQAGCPRGSAVEARLLRAPTIFLWRPILLGKSATVTVQGEESAPALVLMGRDVTHERHYEEALQESELRHRALLAGVLDPLVVMDSYGMVQSVSDSVLPVLGYRPEELVGRNVSLLMPEPHRSSHDAYLANYRRTGLTNILGETREFDITHRDGTPLTIELSVSRVDVPGREEPLFTGSIRDITARKQAERRLVQSEALLRAVFDQEYQLVALLDLEGHAVEANPRFQSVLGLRWESIAGQPFLPLLQSLISPEQSESLRKGWSDALDGSFIRQRVEVVQGEPCVLDLSIKVIQQDGEAAFVLLEGRDITEMERAKRRETEILQSLAQIGESAALLAHEIKTPVTAVNHALRAVADKLGQEDREVLGDLERRMRRLQNTLKTTLSFVGPVDLALGPCVLPDMIEEAISDLHETAGEARVEVALLSQEEIVFEVDRGRIQEVLCNLISNAVSILDPGGRVELRYEQRDAYVHIIVQDDGPGISPQIEGRIFEPYASGREGGTGLGLAISKRFVEAHGGTLRLIPSPLGGAGFEIQLPKHPLP